MPWFIEKRGEEFCIVKGTREDPETLVKCHATEEAAKAHMAALFASEPDAKGIDAEIQDVAQALQLGDDEIVERASWTSAFISNLPDSSFLHVESGGEKDDEGKTKPRSLRHLPFKDGSGKVDLPHVRNALSRLGQPETGKGWLTTTLRKRLIAKAQRILEDTTKMTRNEFTVYKEGETWRWRSVSSVAIMDKEDEVVSEKAYDDAIAWGRANGFGELDLVHINGTDVGDCDTSIRLGSVLIEGGPFYDIARATKARQAVQADPDYWGVSLKFLRDSKQFDGTTYHGGIRILKRTILPREMAASYHTAIIAEGGTMAELDEGKEKALKKLGLDEAEIAELAVQQKAIEPNEEEGVVEKSQDDEPTFIDRLKQLLGLVEEPPVEEADEPVAAEKSEEVTPQDEAPLEETLKAFGVSLTEQVTKGLNDALVPLTEKVTQIEERQGQFEQALEMIVRTKEDLVLERLEQLPKVVKVAASETDATRTEEDPEPTEKAEGYVPEMWATIKKSVNETLGKIERGYKV